MVTMHMYFIFKDLYIVKIWSESHVHRVHSTGYVHGDLHFRNEMLDWKGTIYIIDFGGSGIPEKRTEEKRQRCHVKKEIL